MTPGGKDLFYVHAHPFPHDDIDGVVVRDPPSTGRIPKDKKKRETRISIR